MAKRPKPGDNVVRGGPRGMRSLPPDLDALARGEGRRVQTTQRPRLRDERAHRLVDGVANRDARAVADARLEVLQAAVKAGDVAAEALATGLAEAVLMRIWRGRSLTNFDAMAEDVLGLPAARARELAISGCGKLGLEAEPLDDETVAIWMRTEAALLEAGVDGRVRIRQTGRGRVLQTSLPVDEAPAAFVHISKRQLPLLRDGLGDRPPRR